MNMDNVKSEQCEAAGSAAGPAIDHFQQVESKGGIFWEPLLFAIGLAEAWRIGIGWGAS